jgi:NTP pyrophosphatase (non-canonical NTP hydrolase)
MNILPTTKFLSNTPAEQLMHMAEELGEIAKSLREGDEQHAKEEAADLQLSCETFIAILGGNGEEERLFAIEKNRARNYYKGAGK